MQLRMESSSTSLIWIGINGSANADIKVASHEGTKKLRLKSINLICVFFLSFLWSFIEQEGCP